MECEIFVTIIWDYYLTVEFIKITTKQYKQENNKKLKQNFTNER